MEEEFLGFSDCEVISSILVFEAWKDLRISEENVSCSSTENVTSAPSCSSATRQTTETTEGNSATAPVSEDMLPDYMSRIGESLEDYLDRAMKFASADPIRTGCGHREKSEKKLTEAEEYEASVSWKWKNMENLITTDVSRLTKRQKDMRQKLLGDPESCSSPLEEIKEEKPIEAGNTTTNSPEEASLVSDLSKASASETTIKDSVDASTVFAELPVLLENIYKKFLQQTSRDWDQSTLSQCFAPVTFSDIKAIKSEKKLSRTASLLDHSQRKRSCIAKVSCPCCIKTGPKIIAIAKRSLGKKIPISHQTDSSPDAYETPEIDTSVLSPKKFSIEERRICKGCHKLKILQGVDFLEGFKLCQRCSHPFLAWVEAPWEHVYTRCERNNCGMFDCYACWFWHCVDLVKTKIYENGSPSSEGSPDDCLEEDSVPLAKAARLWSSSKSYKSVDGDNNCCSKIRYVCRRPNVSLFQRSPGFGCKIPWWFLRNFRLSALPPSEKKIIVEEEKNKLEDEWPVARPVLKKTLANGAVMIVRRNSNLFSTPATAKRKGKVRRSQEGKAGAPNSGLFQLPKYSNKRKRALGTEPLLVSQPTPKRVKRLNRIQTDSRKKNDAKVLVEEEKANASDSSLAESLSTSSFCSVIGESGVSEIVSSLVEEISEEYGFAEIEHPSLFERINQSFGSGESVSDQKSTSKTEQGCSDFGISSEAKRGSSTDGEETGAKKPEVTLLKGKLDLSSEHNFGKKQVDSCISSARLLPNEVMVLSSLKRQENCGNGEFSNPLTDEEIVDVWAQGDDKLRLCTKVLVTDVLRERKCPFQGAEIEGGNLDDGTDVTEPFQLANGEMKTLETSTNNSNQCKPAAVVSPRKSVGRLSSGSGFWGPIIRFRDKIESLGCRNAETSSSASQIDEVGEDRGDESGNFGSFEVRAGARNLV